MIELLNVQTGFTKNMIEKPELDNLASVDRNRNGDGFIWKNLPEDMMASFNAFTYKAGFF